MLLSVVLQKKGLNDPFTGGLSSYGLVLMVAFALLRRDTFSATAAASDKRFDDSGFDRQQPPLSPTRLGRPDNQESDGCGCEYQHIPPSPGHSEDSEDHSSRSLPPSTAFPIPKLRNPERGRAGRTVGPSSLGRQRGFWRRSSFMNDRSTAMGTFAARPRHTDSHAININNRRITSLGDGQPSEGHGKNVFNVFWDRYVGLLGYGYP